MITRFPGFIGPSYVSQSVNVDCQRCVNMYPEMDELGTGKEREVASLVATPGLRLLATLIGPVRGLFFASTGILYAVGGNTLYSVSSSWVATSMGTLNTATGAVSMADNGIQLIVVDGASGYALTLSNNTFTQITDPNFLGADQVSYIDGYFIFNKPASGEFFISELNGDAFNALDIAFAEGLPDNIVGHVAMLQNLYIFGTQSVEVFYDSGDVFPFSRIQGAVLQVGCASAFSIAKLQNQLYWLGGDDTGSGIVYRMQGYQPQRISNPAVESAIKSAGASNISQARAWVYQDSGHLFYVLNVPGLSSTWVYDASTSLWHERTWLNLWSQERHRANCSASAYGVIVVGDYVNGNLYALESATLTDNGTSIVRTRTAPHASKDMKRVFHAALQLDMEVGVGLDGVGQGTDPMVILDWSDDGGHTFVNERTMSAGKIGATKSRVISRRLGASRDRVYRIRISDPVKVTLIGAELDIEEGDA